MSRWSDINESILENRNQVSFEFESMDEFEQESTISEAIAIAAEGKFLATEITESFLAFNKQADDRELSAAMYLEEAFSVGGFFKKILDILTKFWGMIVSFFKAIMNKVVGSGTDGSVKTLKDLLSKIEVLEGKVKDGFKQVDGKDGKVDAKVSYKAYDLDAAVTTVKKLLSAGSYLDYKLSGDITLVTLTNEAVKFLNDNRVEKEDGGYEKRAMNPNTTNTATEALKKTNEDLEKLIKEVGLGDKGAGTLLIKFLKDDAAVAAVVDKDGKIKDEDKAKVSTILSVLASKFFAKDAEEQKAEPKSRLSELKSLVENLLTGAGSATTGSTKTSAQGLAANGFAEAGRQAQDILDTLKEAAKKIGKLSFKNTADKGLNADEAKDKNKEENKAYEEFSKVIGKYSTNLLEVQSSMQSVITGGLDAGANILKAIVSELSKGVAAIEKLAGSFKSEKDSLDK